MKKEKLYFPQDEALNIAVVTNRLFLVSFLGRDERGLIVRGIEIMAESSEHALQLVKDVSASTEIYSAIEV